MKQSPEIISGGSHSDERGKIRFVNDFDMLPVRRFYCLMHPDTKTIRAWRGHKIEQRWLFVNKGAFTVKLVEIDNWEKPSPDLEPISFTLKSTENSILHIPAGYASGLQALEKNSEVIVFADAGMEDVKNDDYLFPSDYFGDWVK